jgi:NADH:ubiquinone oxidoreductase subunit 5 (subunit L)/multisubunit Na+/H+ antiporter MnhA subunit
VRGTLWIGQALRAFDVYVIDMLVNMVGLGGIGLANLYGWFDTHIVDGMVNLTAYVVGAAGGRLRYWQTGRAQNYLLVIALGVIILVAAGLLR